MATKIKTTQNTSTKMTYIMEKSTNKNMGRVACSSGQLCSLLSMLGLSHFLTWD